MQIERHGRTLNLSGDFDVRHTLVARDAIYALLARHRGDVVVDLSGVATIDVTALRVLAVASRTARSQGRHLRLRGCGPAVRRMLHKSRLIRVVEMERAATAV